MNEILGKDTPQWIQPTFCTDCWPHWPDRATTERVVPMRCTGGAGRTHRETAGGQVGNFFYWQREWEMSVQIQLTDFRHLSKGEHLQPNWNIENSSQVTLEQLKTYEDQVTTSLMLWEPAKHWFIIVCGDLVSHILTEVSIFLSSCTSY